MITGLEPKPSGEVKVKVTFNLDMNGCLTVTALNTLKPDHEVKINLKTI